MRDQLIGYLLDALEPSEHEAVEAQLSRDPQLARELELLTRSLQPLAADRGYIDPPLGLAHRTCEFVANQSKVTLRPPAGVPAGWTLADLVVAAGIFLAATLLFFPAVSQSRFAARVAGCQNNLRRIGVALADYSNLHRGSFPIIPVNRRLAAAGFYAQPLVEQGLISDEALICPDSGLASRRDGFHVPTRAELCAAQNQQFARLVRQMGGSYGYNIGYIWQDQYQPTKNLHRARFAIMSDAPSNQAPYHSLNHDGCGQNVLFEDGHVQYLTTCKAHGCNDNIFVNDEGERAPGTHRDDAVILGSDAETVPPEMVIRRHIGNGPRAAAP